MEIETEDEADSVLFKVSGDLTIYFAEQFNQALFDKLQTNTMAKLKLDLANVAEIDSAGIQILYLAKEWAKQHQCELAIVKTSSDIDNVLALYRLDINTLEPVSESETGLDLAAKSEQ